MSVATDATGAADLSGAVQELLADREIVDAVYRFGAGQDLKDRELFLSAFAGDAVLDFTQPAGRFGGDIPLMPDRATIAGILDVLAPIITSHTVTNPRVTRHGPETAQLWALVEAQHVVEDEPERRLLLKNTYDVDLRRDGARWLITRLVIRCLWHDGDPTVLFGPDAAA